MALLNYTPPVDPYLQIIHRDEELVILDKPAGLLSVPGRQPQHADSVQRRVQRILPQARIVHRLDMATSGLMVMALNADSHRHLSSQFEKRKTKKRYLARVEGRIEAENGSVDLPMRCDWPNRPKQMIDKEQGKSALTHYRTLERNSNDTLVSLEPFTGRSHQLRLHMLAIGHPILGDRLYGDPDRAQRLMLHAETLAFFHPRDESWISFSSPCSFIT